MLKGACELPLVEGSSNKSESKFGFENFPFGFIFCNSSFISSSISSFNSSYDNGEFIFEGYVIIFGWGL